MVALLLPLAVAAAGSGTVVASGDDFTPKAVTIRAGDTVTWRNDSGLHNVVFDDGSYRSGKPTSDKKLGHHRFTTAGTYSYHCDIHVDSGMVGTVTVQPADPDAPTFSSISFARTVTGGRLRGTVAGTAGARLAVRVSRGGGAVGHTSKTLGDDPAKVTVRLRRSVRQALAAGRHPRVLVKLALDSDAGTATASRRVRLRR